MSYSGLLSTVNLYRTQKTDLTGELSDILMSLTRASRKGTELMYEETQQKAQIKEDYKTEIGELETPEAYAIRRDEAEEDCKYELDQVEAEFELQLEKINCWEQELEFQKQTKETQVQMTGSYLESFTEVLKNNIKKDFTYGQGK